MEESQNAPIMGGTDDIADAGIPIVATLVYEAEAKPRWVGKTDAGHAARMRGAVVNPVRGEGIRLTWKCLAAPAAVCRGKTATFNGISGVELHGHELERGSRQRDFESAARCVDQKEIVALLDAGRGQDELTEHASSNRRDSSKPRLAAVRDRPEKNCGRGDDEKRVTEKIVDRKAQRRKHEDERAEPAPRPRTRVAANLTARRIWGDQRSGSRINSRIDLDVIMRSHHCGVAAAISATIASAAAFGSAAAVIGRPTTRWSAPAAMAAAGVMTRF